MAFHASFYAIALVEMDYNGDVDMSQCATKGVK